MKNEPAFPVNNLHYNYGLTKREYIATQVLAAIIGGRGGNWNNVASDTQIAKDAVRTTDILLTELSRKPNE